VGQPHLSNFLHHRRGLSLKTLDRILEAQRMQVADLLPARRELSREEQEKDLEEVVEIPLVTPSAAVFDPYIRASSTQATLYFPGDAVKGLEPRCSNLRRQWDRFVAVRIGADEARPMEPVLAADAVVVLDRHYTSFHAFREGEVNLYGARLGSRLVVRYAQFDSDRVVLRALRGKVKAEVVELEPGETANDLLVGRVVLVVNPH